MFFIGIAQIKIKVLFMDPYSFFPWLFVANTARCGQIRHNNLIEIKIKKIEKTAGNT